MMFCDLPILTNEEFAVFQKIIFSEVGISLEDTKMSMVSSRLYARMRHYNLLKFSDYLHIVQMDKKEKIEMINLITTNETYFFREINHFNFLTKQAMEHKSSEKLRIWSAASSVGAEAYSCAMICDTYLGKNWEIIGSDINTEVIKKARIGLYPAAWVDKIPENYRAKYCLKGTRTFQGTFLVDRKLAENTRFFEHNLMLCEDAFGMFDIVFLRNVLIYFNSDTKQLVINNVLRNLKIGGYLIISLTENLNGLDIHDLEKVDTSIYQKIR